MSLKGEVKIPRLTSEGREKYQALKFIESSSGPHPKVQSSRLSGHKALTYCIMGTLSDPLLL